DVDCDRRITILDQRGHCPNAPCPLSHTVTLGETQLELTALHQAAQFAVELAAGLEHAEQTTASLSIDLQRVFQNPVDYLAEQIERRYWSGLTRTISTNAVNLSRALVDEKQGVTHRQEAAWCQQATPQCSELPSSLARSASNEPRRAHYLYVPERDKTALAAYTRLTSTRSPPLAAGQPLTTPSLDVRVAPVPSEVTPEWVNELTRDDKHGL